MYTTAQKELIKSLSKWFNSFYGKTERKSKHGTNLGLGKGSPGLGKGSPGLGNGSPGLGNGSHGLQKSKNSKGTIHDFFLFTFLIEDFRWNLIVYLF